MEPLHSQGQGSSRSGREKKGMEKEKEEGEGGRIEREGKQQLLECTKQLEAFMINLAQATIEVPTRCELTLNIPLKTPPHFVFFCVHCHVFVLSLPVPSV